MSIPNTLFRIKKSCYKIEKASEFALPFVLSHTVLHITEFSSVVKEAAINGIHSIVLHPYGKELFEGEVKQGTATYVEDSTPERLIATIKKLTLSSDNDLSLDTDLKFYEKFKAIFLQK